jgi:hypothetical protein
MIPVTFITVKIAYFGVQAANHINDNLSLVYVAHGRRVLAIPWGASL